MAVPFNADRSATILKGSVFDALNGTVIQPSMNGSGAGLQPRPKWRWSGESKAKLPPSVKTVSSTILGIGKCSLEMQLDDHAKLAKKMLPARQVQISEQWNGSDGRKQTSKQGRKCNVRTTSFRCQVGPNQHQILIPMPMPIPMPRAEQQQLMHPDRIRGNP